MGTDAKQSRPAAAGRPEGSARPRVLHSHHYSVLLQRALQETNGLDAAALISRAAAEAVYQSLTGQPEWAAAAGRDERLREAMELFRSSGLGSLDLSGVTDAGGEATVSGSHFGEAWLREVGSAARPVCGAAAGFIAGSLAAVYGGSFRVEETRCVAVGAPACSFRSVPDGGAPELSGEDGADRSVIPFPAAAAPPLPWSRADDAVASLLEELSVATDGGRIRALDQEMSHLWADYYNRAAYRFEQEIPRALGNKFSSLPSLVLTEVGHRYAYHSFGSLLVSDAWQERVRPALETREDWVHALVALINGLGWGAWRVHALVPGERLSVRVYEGYEGSGYRRQFGRSDQPRCYLARGVAAAIMNLLYVGDITARPELGRSHYNQLFRTPLSFRAVETRCRAMDDACCELVVNPLSPALAKRARGEQL